MTRADTSRQGARRLPVMFERGEMPLRVWVQMMRTHTRIGRRIEGVLEKHSLSIAQFDVLATLRAGEGITQQELAARLLVTKGNVCALLDRMERSGWVRRRPDATDRRANRLHLTPKAVALLDAVFPEHHQNLSKIMNTLKPAELQLLHDLLDRLEESAS